MGQKGKITKIPNSQARQNYVVKGATLKCTCGNANSQLQTPGRKSAGIHNNLQANIMDYKPMLNIQPFGYCRSIQNPAVQAATATHHGRLTPAPCMPNTTMPWVFGKQNVIVDGAPAMLDACMNKCLWGGTILISKDGQVMPVSRSVNKERMAQGVDKIANGGLMAMIGLGALAVGLTILTAPVSVPTLLVAASVTTVAAGGACVAMGGSDIAEGEQDVVYGATGSNRNSVNPLRDKVFMGNSEAYGTAEMIVATTAVVGEAGLAPYAATLGGGELAAKKGMTDKTAANKTANQNVLTDGKNRIAVKKIDARPGAGKNVTSAQGLKAGKVNAVGNTKLAGNAATKPQILDNYRTINKTSAEEVNKWWKEVMNYENPPYKPGTKVNEIELTKKTTFVRVYDGETSGMYGGWIMKAEDINGMTPAQIQDKFALPSSPKYVVDVNLEAGTHLRTGVANPLEGWGNGGGTQYDLMGQRTGEFVNPRPLQ